MKPPTNKKLKLSVAERFWAMVSKPLDDLGGCWLWLGCRNHNLYGVFGFKRKTQLAHRVAWILVNGAIPDGLNICHRCDNPSCVNPNHLWLGTQKDNINDMVAKGRWATGDTSQVARGEENGSAKATTDDVKKIRELYAIGNTTYKELAKQFGVSETPVYQIVKHITWKHITC